MISIRLLKKTYLMMFKIVMNLVQLEQMKVFNKTNLIQKNLFHKKLVEILAKNKLKKPNLEKIKKERKIKINQKINKVMIIKVIYFLIQIKDNQNDHQQNQNKNKFSIQFRKQMKIIYRKAIHLFLHGVHLSRIILKLIFQKHQSLKNLIVKLILKTLTIPV